MHTYNTLLIGYSHCVRTRVLLCFAFFRRQIAIVMYIVSIRMLASVVSTLHKYIYISEWWICMRMLNCWCYIKFKEPMRQQKVVCKNERIRIVSMDCFFYRHRIVSAAHKRELKAFQTICTQIKVMRKAFLVFLVSFHRIRHEFIRKNPPQHTVTYIWRAIISFF